jgi:hypothetical protein
MLGRAAVWALAMAALAGCSSLEVVGPDDDLPGVRTTTTLDDDFRCGALLFPQGCVIVRIPHVDSGCSPEVGGYVLCDATLDWVAGSGAVLPGSRLSVAVNGTERGTCEPAPGEPCQVSGSLNQTHHFGGPGQNETWRFIIDARLSSPGDAPETTGHFTLTIDMLVRTEPVSDVTS